MPTVYVKTLGCKVNTYDSHALETQFKALGYDLVDDPAAADISILNTCSVTNNADREARYLLRRFRRENPEALVAATGCYAQTDSARLVAMDEVDLVFPNQVKDEVVSTLHDVFRKKQAGEDGPTAKLPEQINPVSENKQGHFKSSLTLFEADPSQTRAFLKIQDGCNGFCAYCLIPYARGASRSVGPDAVLGEIRRLLNNGIQEIVFTGIHIGDYGEDFTADQTSIRSMAALLREVTRWPDMVRYRISSLEPNELTPELLDVMAERPELVCDHFHLPLQSGHDRVLKAMRRQYTTTEYADTVALARKYFPQANFGADVIPGFPGESDDEAADTIRFIQETGLNYLHVFPYSKRPNTAAIRYPDHVDAGVLKVRAQRLRELSETLKAAYTQRFIGQSTPVLWENRMDDQGRRLGLTSNYLEVALMSGREATPGTISAVQLKGFVEGGRLLGKPLS